MKICRMKIGKTKIGGMVTGAIQQKKSWLLARRDQLQLQVFLLAGDQADQLAFRFISAHGFWTAVFEFRLRAIKGEDAIRPWRQRLGAELSVRGHEYVSELSGTIRERNAIDMGLDRFRRSGRRSRSPGSFEGCGDAFDRTLNFGCRISHGIS